MKLFIAIIEFVLCCADLVFLLLIPTFQLGRQKNIKKWHITLYIFIAGILSTLYNLLTDLSISSMYIGLLLSIMYILMFNQGTIVSKLFWMVFPLLTLYVIELAIFQILSEVYPKATLAPYSNLYWVAVIFTKLMQAAVMVIAYRFKLPITKGSGTLILPITLSLLSLSIFELLGNRIWQFGIALFFINLIYILFMVQINQKHRREMETKFLAIKKQSLLESAALREHFSKLEGNVYNSMQKIWNEAKNQNSPEIEKYLESFSNINMQFSKMFDTGDTYLDMVMSAKYALATKKGIAFKPYIQGKLNVNLDYTDIGNILIYLIDNAFEILEAIENEEIKQMIEVCIFDGPEDYSLIVANTTDGQEIPSINTLIAEDKERFGMKAVQDIISQYTATLKSNHENNYYTVTVKFLTN